MKQTGKNAPTIILAIKFVVYVVLSCQAISYLSRAIELQCEIIDRQEELIKILITDPACSMYEEVK